MKGGAVELFFCNLSWNDKIQLFQEPDVEVLKAMIGLSHTLVRELKRRSGILAIVARLNLTVVGNAEYFETQVVCPKTSTVGDLVKAATETFPWEDHRD
jgi:hypothetical protein